MLKFNVRNQSISRVDSFQCAEKSVNYLIAQFNFKTDDWNGTIKTAVFKNPTSSQMYDQILDEDHCVVPWESISDAGKVEVSVYGVNGDCRITTDIEKFTLNKTLYGGSGTQKPTLSVYEQLLNGLGNVDGGTFEDWK